MWTYFGTLGFLMSGAFGGDSIGTNQQQVTAERQQATTSADTDQLVQLVEPDSREQPDLLWYSPNCLEEIQSSC